MIIVAIAIVIFSIILHEVAHGYVAYWLGDPTAKYAGRLTLNPIPHIDLVGSILIPAIAAFSGGFILGWAKPVPINPYNIRHGKWGEALVAFAGPGTNILLAAVAALVVRFGGAALHTPEVLTVIFTVVIANLSLAILNLLPIPLLDGSKIVAAFLPYQLEREYRKLEALTYALGPFGLILILIVIFNFLSPTISSLVFWFFTLFTGIRL